MIAKTLTQMIMSEMKLRVRLSLQNQTKKVKTVKPQRVGMMKLVRRKAKQINWNLRIRSREVRKLVLTVMLSLV